MKTHLISASITFVASFLTVFGAALMQHSGEPITGALLASLAFTAVRAAVKPVGEYLVASMAKNEDWTIEPVDTKTTN